MCCLPPCLPCWRQPKSCVPACQCWCQVDCICLPPHSIALSLPPTHRYTTKTISCRVFTYMDEFSAEMVSVSCLGPSWHNRAVCRSCIPSQSVWSSPKITVTSEICSLLSSCCPVVHQRSAPCQTCTTQGTFSFLKGTSGSIRKRQVP